MVGAILVGGKGTRLGGTAKGLLKHHDQTILQRTYGLVSSVCKEVYLVGDAHDYAHYKIESIPDAYPNGGPISGIAGALQTLKKDVLIVPCDLPNLNCTILKRLIDERDGPVIACKTPKRTHPLVSLWTQETLAVVSDYAQQARSVHAAFHRCGGRWLEFRSESPFFNVNTPDDLEGLK